MKTKRYFYLAAVALSVLAMNVLPGCNDQNTPEEKPDDKPAELKPVAAYMDFQATFDTLTLEMCDIAFDYIDMDGSKKHEVVTEPVWRKDFDSTALPVTFAYHWSIEIKEDLDTTKYQHFVVKCEFSYESHAIASDGRLIMQSADEGTSFSILQQPAMRKREVAIEAIHKSYPFSFVHKYDANGKFSTGTWEE